MNIVFEMNSALADVMPVTHYVQESSSRKFQPGRKSLAGKTRKCINPPPSRNRTKHPKSIQPQKQHNTAIKFLLFLGCHPGSSKPRPTGRGNVPVAHSYPKSNYLKNTTITSVDFHSSKGPSPEVPLKFLNE